MRIEGVQVDDGPRERFIECPDCGDWLDMQDLGEVLGHECGPPLVPAENQWLGD